MLIRSQDKEILANMEGPIAIEILSDGNGHTTMYWKDSYALGTYSSKEKAIKVLDMIQGAYMDFEAAKITSTGLATTAYTGSYDTPESVACGIKALKGYAEIIKESVIFQMPEDSEVEV
jgi:hypothetical protein